MALTRAAGYKYWKTVIEANLEAFPSVEEKRESL
jgi:hypothetical protein